MTTASLDAILALQEQLLQDFETKLQQDRYKENLLDQLHQELQGYRNQLVKKQVQPILLDLIHLLDDLQRTIARFETVQADELEAGSLLRTLSMFPQDLLDILYRQGVDPYVCQEPEFDPHRQHLVRTVAATDGTAERRVATSLRPGYVWDGAVLRKEYVEVYKYQPDAARPDGAEKPADSPAPAASPRIEPEAESATPALSADQPEENLSHE